MLQAGRQGICWGACTKTVRNSISDASEISFRLILLLGGARSALNVCHVVTEGSKRRDLYYGIHWKFLLH